MNTLPIVLPNRELKAIAAENSVIVLGEAGTGKADFVVALHDEMSGEYQVAIATCWRLNWI